MAEEPEILLEDGPSGKVKEAAEARRRPPAMAAGGSRKTMAAGVTIKTSPKQTANGMTEKGSSKGTTAGTILKTGPEMAVTFNPSRVNRLEKAKAREKVKRAYQKKTALTEITAI